MKVIKRKLNSIKNLIIDRSIQQGLLKGNSQYTKFIILGTERVGSNYLGDFLNSHPNIVFYLEIFHREQSFWGTWAYQPANIDKALELRKLHPIEFLNRYVFRKYARKTNVIGFKIFYHHARNKNNLKVWDYLRHLPQIKIIHLKRQNLLDSFISNLYSNRSNLFVVTKKNQIVEQKAILVNYEQLNNYFIRISSQRNEFDNFFQDNHKMEVFYEKLTQNTTTQLNRIQEFLNVDKKKLHSRMLKISKKKTSERIINYQELKDMFKDSEFIQYFVD